VSGIGRSEVDMILERLGEYPLRRAVAPSRANWQRTMPPKDIGTVAAAQAVLWTAIAEFFKRGDHWGIWQW
jgi:hypothetical protein